MSSAPTAPAAATATERLTEPPAFRRASAQVAQVFGSHNAVDVAGADDHDSAPRPPA